VEAQLAALASRRLTLSDEQRHRRLTLGQDLGAVWEHPAASAALKKRMLRPVLHAISIDTRPEPPEHLLQLHWHGGVPTELRVVRHPVGKHGRATPQQALEVIRELSKVCRDQTMAATLNRLGYRTGTGTPWRTHSVACVRYQYRLPNFPKAHDWLTLEQAAAQVGVSATVLRRLIAHGTLPASQVVPSAPWMIHASDLQLLAVQTTVRVVQAGRCHAGRRLGQVSPQAGDDHASLSPAETCSPKLQSGAP
jgi:Helix-turn-helix domain